jgi:hypothetical protein
MTNNKFHETITPRAYLRAFDDYMRVNRHLTYSDRAFISRLLVPIRDAAASAGDGAPPADIKLLCAMAYNRLDALLDAAEASDPPDEDFIGTASIIRLNIEKSNLLERLIYWQEPVRTVPCPEHKGRQHTAVLCGINPPCPHGCQGTGWLP